MLSITTTKSANSSASSATSTATLTTSSATSTATLTTSSATATSSQSRDDATTTNALTRTRPAKPAVPAALVKQLLAENETLATEQKSFAQHVAFSSSAAKLWHAHEGDDAFVFRPREKLAELARDLAQLAATDSPSITASYLSFGGGDVATEQIWPAWATMYTQSARFGGVKEAGEQIDFVERQLGKVMEESADRGSNAAPVVGLGLMLTSTEVVEVSSGGQVRLSREAMDGPVDGVERTVDNALELAKGNHQLGELRVKWGKLAGTDKPAAIAVLVREAVTVYQRATGKGEELFGAATRDGQSGKVNDKAACAVAKAAFRAGPDVFVRLVFPAKGGAQVVPVRLSVASRVAWGGEYEGKLSPGMVTKAAAAVATVLTEFAAGRVYRFHCGAQVRGPVSVSALAAGGPRTMAIRSDVGQVLEDQAVKSSGANRAAPGTKQSSTTVGGGRARGAVEGEGGKGVIGGGKRGKAAGQ